MFATIQSMNPIWDSPDHGYGLNIGYAGFRKKLSNNTRKKGILNLEKKDIQGMLPKSEK